MRHFRVRLLQSCHFGLHKFVEGTKLLPSSSPGRRLCGQVELRWMEWQRTPKKDELVFFGGFSAAGFPSVARGGIAAFECKGDYLKSVDSGKVEP